MPYLLEPFDIQTSQTVALTDTRLGFRIQFQEPAVNVEAAKSFLCVFLTGLIPGCTAHFLKLSGGELGLIDTDQATLPLRSAEDAAYKLETYINEHFAGVGYRLLESLPGKAGGQSVIRTPILVKANGEPIVGKDRDGRKVVLQRLYRIHLSDMERISKSQNANDEEADSGPGAGFVIGQGFGDFFRVGSLERGQVLLDPTKLTPDRSLRAPAASGRPSRNAAQGEADRVSVRKKYDEILEFIENSVKLLSVPINTKYMEYGKVTQDPKVRKVVSGDLTGLKTFNLKSKAWFIWIPNICRNYLADPDSHDGYLRRYEPSAAPASGGGAAASGGSAAAAAGEFMFQDTPFPEGSDSCFYDYDFAKGNLKATFYKLAGSPRGGGGAMRSDRVDEAEYWWWGNVDLAYALGFDMDKKTNGDMAPSRNHFRALPPDHQPRPKTPTKQNASFEIRYWKKFPGERPVDKKNHPMTTVPLEHLS